MLDFSHLAHVSKHIGKLKIFVLLLLLLPLFILIHEFYLDELGIDPLDRLTRLTGKSALVLLLLSLVVTPIRHFLIKIMIAIRANYGKRLSDWNWIIKLRRTIGVMSFFYALIHFIIYFWLDQGLDYNNAIYDIKERNFIAVGLTAFVFLIPLFLTSTNKMMKVLGKKWRKLHRTVYLIAFLATLHFWMLTKVGVFDYVPYVFLTFFLLGWRVWYYGAGRKNKLIDDGMEAIDREQVTRIINNLNFLAGKTFGEYEGERMVSILFNILSSESHYSESILNLDNENTFKINESSKSMVNRLKVARKKSKEKISIPSIIGLQTGGMPVILELVEKIDLLLKQGVEADQKNDDEVMGRVWTEIFSILMPIPES